MEFTRCSCRSQLLRCLLDGFASLLETCALSSVLPLHVPQFGRALFVLFAAFVCLFTHGHATTRHTRPYARPLLAERLFTAP